MNKLILLLFISLGALVACRSGKGVTQTQKGGKDSVKVVENKVPDSVLQQEIIRKKMEAFLADTATYFAQLKEKENKLKEEQKKVISELKLKGKAYSSDNNLVEYEKIDNIPQVISNLFPNALFFTSEAMLGQGKKKRLFGALNDIYGDLPGGFNRILNDGNIQITKQLEALLILSQYPFAQCSIENIIEENYPCEINVYSYSYKAQATFNNESVLIRIACQNNKIFYLTIYYNNGGRFTIQLF